MKKDISSDLKKRLEYEFERIERLKIDYSIPEEKALEVLRKEFPEISMEKIEEWHKKGYIDYILIGSNKYYYKRFLYNLLFLCEDKICIEKRETKAREHETMRKKLKEHIYEIINSGSEGYINPRKVRVLMKIKVKSDSVPEGEIIRCWLPFPRVDEQQNQVRLLECFPEKYSVSSPNHPQRTIYFEQEARSGDIEFWVKFEYTIRAFYKSINPKEVKPYDKDDPIYIAYTREQPPHIVFTRYIKNLAKEIIGDEDNPYLMAKKIYDWITKNMTYTYVAEYSTYESISEYVSRNLRGDCGFHAILFITLCRVSGIPARWQSGWYANPVAKGPSPHDWAQFYIKPYGWLYADLSFGRYWRTRDTNIHGFYFGNIDSFRTIFNVDIMAQFDPPKKYYRSDPVDNQRGEIEWADGNIYYDMFEYEIVYI